MNDTPWAHIRGAMGDLIVLLPILQAWLKQQTSKDKVNLLVTGPLNVRTVSELLILSTGLTIENLYVNNEPTSSYPTKFKKVSDAFEAQNKIKFDLILNNVVPFQKDIKILRADEILPDIKRDYTSIKYYPTNHFELAQRIGNYCIFSMIGNSNQLWNDNAERDIYKHMMEWILNNTDCMIVFVGHNTPKDIYKVHPSSFFTAKQIAGRFVSLYNLTSLSDLVVLLENSCVNICFDNGIKNLAFLQSPTTIFIHDNRWVHANPIEAWYPLQLWEKNEFVEVENREQTSFYPLIDYFLEEAIRRKPEETDEDQDHRPVQESLDSHVKLFTLAEKIDLSGYRE